MAVQLICYASKGRLDKVEACVDRGVHVDATNFAEETALYHAALSGRRNCVEFLLKLGANPNRVSKQGLTPVNAACRHDNAKCLALLVRYGGIVDRIGERHQQSAMETAIRHKSRRATKLLNYLKKEALTREGRELHEQEKRRRKDSKKPRGLVGASAVVPCLDPVHLRRPSHIRVLSNGANTVLEGALWEATPVTVKRMRRHSRENVARIMKDADVTSQLRHPQVVLLMAVYLGPVSEWVCLVLEPFPFGSLYNLLHESQTELDLSRRIQIVRDAALGLEYLHGAQHMLHCYLNSYAVFICKNFRAKLGNFECSRDISEQQQPVDTCALQERWMAPEQLRGAPPSTAADVYSFGATFWECLSRRVPWSWLDSRSVTKEICEHARSLPVPQSWPEPIKAILEKCLGDEQSRENIKTILEYLTRAENSGGIDKNDDIEMDFLAECRDALTKSNADDDARDSCVHIQARRGSRCDVKARSHSFSGAASADRDDCWRQSEVERFGYKTAEHIAHLRGLHRHSRKSTRLWAKEAVLRRHLDGDSKRVEKTADCAETRAGSRQSSRASANARDTQPLRCISRKYERKVWAKMNEGHERVTHVVKIPLKSSEDEDELEGDSASAEIKRPSSDRVEVGSFCAAESDEHGGIHTGQGVDEAGGVQGYTAEASTAGLGAGTGLEETGLDGAGLEGTALEATGFDETGLKRSGFEGTTLDENGFDEIGLERSNTETTGLERIGLEETGFERICLKGAGLERSGLEETALEGTGLEETGFERSDSEGTSLEGTGLTEVETRDADVRPQSDSTLLLYKRVTCDDMRSSSDGRLGQKFRKLLDITGTYRAHKGSHVFPAEHAGNAPAPLPLPNAKDRRIATETKCKEGHEGRTMSQLSTVSRSGNGDVTSDMTSQRDDVTPVYAITTPMFVTSGAVCAFREDSKLPVVSESVSRKSALVTRSASFPSCPSHSGNLCHSRSLQDLSCFHSY